MEFQEEFYKCCEPQFFLQILAVIMLVVFAGVISGLTMGLLSMSIVDLEVLSKSGTPNDRLHASKILTVVKRNHLLLCTLLLYYTAAAEMLPVFLNTVVHDVVAVLLSVLLVLIFTKIIPEAVFTRYALSLGSVMTPVIHLLIWISFPVAYPISKLLDSLLGIPHEPLFRRAELKTLVNFHGTEAGKGGDLSLHETSIISGALDLTEKTANDAMTPLSEIFAIDINTKLTRDIINLIMEKGHSRVPVYYEKPKNIIGLFLVKNLLTIKPADALPAKSVVIRRIPRISETMPLYDVLNEFQKGFSHMAAVVKDHSRSMASDQIHSKYTSDGSMREVALEIHEGDPPEIKSIPSFRSLKNLPGSSRTSSRVQSRSMRWSSGRLYSDVLNPSELSRSVRAADGEVIGIISMEDVIEELLKEKIPDETNHHSSRR